MPPRIVPLAVAAALALVTAGAATPAFADSGHSHVTVVATSDHHLHMRTHLQAGVVQFDVRGAANESLQLAHSRNGAGAAQLAADGNELSSAGKATDLERDFTAVGGVGTGHSVWVRLAPGTYYAIDTNAQTTTADEVVTLHVWGDVHRGRLPRGGATIAAIHEMEWANWPARMPAAGVLRFVNASSDYHFVDLERLNNPATTLDQVKTALQNNDQSLIDTAWIYDTGVLSPHHVQASSYHLKPGTYAVMCWWPDENGVPHALMGMVRLIHVG